MHLCRKYLFTTLFTLLAPDSLAQLPTPTNLSELSATIASKYASVSICSSVFETCQPTSDPCATSICEACTSLGQTQINACCSATDSPLLDCFQSVLRKGGPNVYGPGTTPPPVPSNTDPYGGLDSNFLGCEKTRESSSICESLSPGFESETAFQLQAPCLCYNDAHEWIPDEYDRNVEKCFTYLGGSAAIGGNIRTAPCRQLGDVVASYFSEHPSAVPTTTTTGTGDGSGEQGNDGNWDSGSNGGVSGMASKIGLVIPPLFVLLLALL